MVPQLKTPCSGSVCRASFTLPVSLKPLLSQLTQVQVGVAVRLWLLDIIPKARVMPLSFSSPSPMHTIFYKTGKVSRKQFKTQQEGSDESFYLQSYFFQEGAAPNFSQGGEGELLWINSLRGEAQEGSKGFSIS